MDDSILLPSTTGGRKERCSIPLSTKSVVMGGSLLQRYCVLPAGINLGTFSLPIDESNLNGFLLNWLRFDSSMASFSLPTLLPRNFLLLLCKGGDPSLWPDLGNTWV